MLLRAANPDDRPAIIQLLRQSLGESSIPKSEALWVWKHELNPFGPSYVMVAEENNTLVGVRAFMQWEWRRDGKIYKSVRAVDTATHPDYQGKGIFKKLTLEQAAICEAQGVQFIFNTPNLQSRPGYLKMGWVQQGRMPLKIKLLRPLSMGWAKLFDKQKFPGSTIDPTPFQKWTNDVLGLPDRYTSVTTCLSTVVSAQYISWRYANNPLFSYNYFTDNQYFLLIGRIKNHAYTRELRLVDFVLLDPAADKRYLNSYIQQAVLRYCNKEQIGFISFSGRQYRENRHCFKWMGYLPVRALGPVITLRDLNMKDKFHHLLRIQNWCYSIGDLELF
jgi:GNAT superfamily N-acetyltransferase